ncbi:MAG: DUF4838 domain-containing protein [Victivallaceae bacterium]
MKVFILLLSTMLMGYATFADKCKIAENGIPKIVIVINKNAPETVQFAANELKKYLDKITGGSFQITTTVPTEKKGIFLGEAAGSKLASEMKKVKRDGYFIKADLGNLYIAGIDDRGPRTDIFAKLEAVKKASFESRKSLMADDSWSFNRGTLYGVYRLLEQFGVRWFMPGPEGEIIPSLKNLAFDGEINENPYFETRHVSSFVNAPYGYIKNESVNFNRDFSELQALSFTPAANILWNMRMRGSSMPLPLNHRPPAMGWKERFGATHPEYFALLANGQRNVDVKKSAYRDHLCYSNSGVMRETLNEIKFFREGRNASEINVPERITKRYPYNRGWNPAVAIGNTFSLLPHDSFVACQCPECLKLAAPAGTSANSKDSKLVWSFINRAAEEVKKNSPDTKIVCLAYSSYSRPYSGMKKLPDNVIVGFCCDDLKRPYMLYYKDKFKEFEALVNQWEELSDGPMAFWLHCLYRWAKPQNYAVPIHIPEMYDRVVKVMAKHGRYAYIQINEDSIMYELFNRYMLMKKLYSPELDTKVLFNDYLERFYGPQAAPIIKQVYDDIEKRDIEMLTCKAGKIETWNKFFTPEIVAAYRKQVTEAEKVTAGTQYEKAVKLFSKYYIGLLEKGQHDFDKNIRQTMKTPASNSSFCALRGSIVIDGAIDEKAWDTPIRRLRMVNNINAKPTQWSTEVRLTQSSDKLYFAFTCQDPQTMERSLKKGEMESIEIFLDPSHGHNSYYQIMIDMDGTVTDMYYEGNGEQGNIGWKSHAEVAVKRYHDHWVMEVAIPRQSFSENELRPTHPWGGNFCRSMQKPPVKEDRFSTWSQMIRGSFHQPDMFGHLFFVN